MYRIAFFLAVALLVGLVLVGQGRSGEDPLPDSQVGLSKVGVTELPTPERTIDNESAPGDAALLGAAYSGGPPLIPHAVKDFLPITLDRNDCVDCHMVDEKLEGEPTPIPVSHYTELRFEPKDSSADLVGARYNCVVCHVAPGGNPPLVDNDF